MQDTNLESPVTNSRRLRTALVLFLALALLIIGIVFVTRGHYDSHSLTPTPLNYERDFGYLKGDDIYAYNGMAFYKKNIKDGSLTTLSSGRRLPTPKSVIWANNKGALMTFSSSFSLSVVSDKLNQRNEPLDEISQAYTWYYNFADRIIHFVSRATIEPSIVYFSEKTQGFYYIERPMYGDESMRLSYFDVNNKKTKVLKEFDETSEVFYVGGCKQLVKVCYVARDQADTGVALYGVDNGDKPQTLIPAQTRIVPTNQENVFVTAKIDIEADDNRDHEAAADEYVDLPATSAQFYDIATKKTTGSGFNLGGEALVVNRYKEGKRFYAIRSDQVEGEQSPYLSGGENIFGQKTTKEGGLSSSSDSTLLASPSIAWSYGKDGTTLVSPIESNQLIIAQSESTLRVQSISNEEAKKVVDSCVRSDANDSQYSDDFKQFKIFFTGEDDFQRKVETFSDCVIAKDRRALYGYNFYFGAVDPISGRITSD